MHALIALCLRQRAIVLGLAALFVLFGAATVRNAPFDAFPEFAPPRVEVQTEAPGMSSEEVEALITTPLEGALGGTPGLTQMRSKSVLGLSSVVLLFDRDRELMHARMLVQERITRVVAQLPAVSRPPVILSPLSSTSRVLKVGISSKTRSQMELTDLVRWTVRPRLMAIQGVANVAIWGERDRQLQVRVDPERLAAHGVALDRLVTIVREAVTPRAGGFVDGPNQRMAVIHGPLGRDAAELANVPISGASKGALTLGDVSAVVEDYPAPIGEALVNEGAGLLLIVEKEPSANTLEVTRRVDAALAALKPGLPGLQIDARIFRPAGFIERALANLSEAMGIGCALVVLVLFTFLWDVRTAIVSVTAIPLSLFAAACVLCALGRTIDTMVIAGLVIALGEVVDDAIIDVENIHRRLKLARASGSEISPLRTVLEASLEVRSAIVYASMIVVLVFVPVLMLDGVAGEFFRPLALAYGLAVIASTLVALTVTPALALLLLSPRSDRRERRSPIAVALARRYGLLVTAAIARPRLIMVASVVAIAASFAAFFTLREQFLPSFQENDFLMHWIARPGTSLEAVRRSADRARAELLQVEGVKSFGAHIGRAEVADEVVGSNFAELWISVDPAVDLPRTLIKVREIVDGYPGVYRDVQTYLQERMREVLSGGGSALVIRIYGPDLARLRDQASALAKDVASVPGVAHSRPEGQVMIPQIEVRPNLERCAALGVDPGVVRARASILVQGERVGQIVRGQQTIDVVIWGVERTRSDLNALRDLAISLDDRTLIRLGDVADVRIVPMQNTIAHDAGSRKIDVVIDLTNDADLGRTAAQIMKHMSAMALPAGHHAELIGEHAARKAAHARLGLAAIVALVGIGLVLLADFRSLRLASLVSASLPFALVGGVIAAVLTGGVVSLGTLVGMVTVVGIAARNGIMMISHFRQLEEHEQVPFGPALVVRGAVERLIPIAMTALATGLALLPLVIRGSVPGNEIEQPLAVVILGGLISSTLLTLVVMPVMYLQFGKSKTLEP